jgi:hypothetical protein
VRSVLVLAVLTLVAAPSAYAELPVGSRSTGDGWTLQVSVEPSDLGPIVVSTGGVRRLPQRCSRCCAPAWVQHDLVLENTGERPVSFGDTRTGAALGPREHPVLLASDQGCGYGGSERRPSWACLMYLDAFTLEPGESVTRTVALWKGLRRMRPLGAGTYVFRKPLRFQVGREIPERGAGRRVTIGLAYRVAAW